MTVRLARGCFGNEARTGRTSPPGPPSATQIGRRGSRVLSFAAPDSCTNGPADAETDAHRYPHNQTGDENLDDDAVALAQCLEAVAAVSIHPGHLGLLAPMLLAGPHVAIGAALCAFGGFAIACIGRDDGFHICVKGVAVVAAGGRSRRRDI